LYHALIDAFQQGNLEKAAHLQQQAIDMIRLLGKYGGMASGKAYMKLIGFDCGEFRLPIKNMNANEFIAFQQDAAGLMFQSHCSQLPVTSSAE
jgi:N-acetylneuraminate lyase